MSTPLDLKLVPKALEIVYRFGINASFAVDKINPDDYDSETGATTPDTPTDTVRKVTPPENYDRHMIDGEVIKFGDMRIFLPASGLTFTPKEGLEVTIAAELWKIEKVGVHYSGEDVAIYELQLRQ